MIPDTTPSGIPVDLTGTAHARGRLQADRCPDMIGAVRHAVEVRMAVSGERLLAPDVHNYLEELRRFHRHNDPEIMEELEGLGSGFGLPPARLFDYLMLSLVEDLDTTGTGQEECTAFAATAADGGVLVAKNRDYRREHVAIQRVFRHRDPAWGGREVLCVGSLGSPGNFSSGMNSDGFAVADTASRTTAHRVGRHRYFLLTRLQTQCTTVADALGEIAATPHAGGGTLVLGDASGCMATVELGAETVAVEFRHGGRVGRTNHYVGDSTATLNRIDAAGDPRHRNSERRLATLRRLLSRKPGEMQIQDASAILSYRGGPDHEPLCRRGGRDLSETVSGAIYATGQRRLWFANGDPGCGNWTAYAFGNDQD